ncbi:MAG: hypothetical protein ACLF0G_07255 [Candidatus Brocadiia bacterium]
MNATCPHCGQSFETEASNAGQEIACSHCQQSFTAPEPPPEAEAGEQEAPQAAAEPEAPAEGPPPPPAPPPLPEKPRPGRKPLVVGAAVVGAAVVVVVAILLLSPRGGLGDLARYVPEDADGLTYLDMEGFRASKVYGRLSKLVDADDAEDVLEAYGGALGPLSMATAITPALELKVDDIAQILSVRMKKGRPIVVLKTARDQPLEKMVKDPGEEQKAGEVAYVKSGEFAPYRYVARTASRTYLLAGDEDGMKDALERLREGKKAKLDPALQQALDAVSGYDHYGSVRGKSRDAEATGFGFDLGSSLDVRVTGLFKEADDAEEAVEEATEDFEKDVERFEEQVSKLRQDVDDGDEDQKHTLQALEVVLDTMRDMSVKRSGNAVTIRAQCRVDRILDALEDAKEAGQEPRKLLGRLWRAMP